MTRRIALIVVALLLVAAPALAKGVDGVTLTGGGQEVSISVPAHLNSPDDLIAVTNAARIYEGMWPESLSNRDLEIEPPAGDLGPRIVAEWHFPMPLPETTITQHLYPFAAAGPVGFVPGGQEHAGSTTTENWHPLSSDIVERLDAVGFDTDALRASGTAGGILPGSPVPWVTALGALAALVAIIAGRTRQVV